MGVGGVKALHHPQVQGLEAARAAWVVRVVGGGEGRGDEPLQGARVREGDLKSLEEDRGRVRCAQYIYCGEVEGAGRAVSGGRALTRAGARGCALSPAEDDPGAPALLHVSRGVRPRLLRSRSRGAAHRSAGCSASGTRGLISATQTFATAALAPVFCARAAGLQHKGLLCAAQAAHVA